MDHTNNNAKQFQLAYHKYLKLRSTAPRIVGRIAVNFFKRSFKNQGMMKNGSVEKWDNLKYAPARRRNNRILIDKGHLRDGIIIKSASPGKVVIGMNAVAAPYAKYQNDGFTAKVTVAMRMHFWKLYYESGKKNQFFKNMALTKKTSITVPPRPFIYDSTDLVDEITKDLMKRIDNIMHH